MIVYVVHKYINTVDRYYTYFDMKEAIGKGYECAAQMNNICFSRVDDVSMPVLLRLTSEQNDWVNVTATEINTD